MRYREWVVVAEWDEDEPCDLDAEVAKVLVVVVAVAEHPA